MMDQILKIYHRSPASVRHVLASARGYQLRSWRYDPMTDQLAAEALERDYWSAEQWKVYQNERLKFILERAATRVPYYRDYWAERRRNGDRSSWAYLENWPVLTKETVRENPTAFVTDDRDRRRNLFHEYTSGTTGKPLDLWSSRETLTAWFALFEARWRYWYGVSRHDRWATLGRQLIAPVEQRTPPFWVWNQPLNQLYMSSYHLAPDLIPSYLDALLKYHIKYISGYTSSVFALAQEIVRLGRHDLQMSVVTTNAEPLFDYQREIIAEAFQCPVRETYGMSEMITAASECEEGHLHRWPETGVVEVVAGGQLVSQGTVGDLICTGFLNADMPLIRYRVGDRGALAMDDEPCECERTLPRFASVEGRSDDVLYTADGRVIGRLDLVFRTRLPVREVQIIQETLKRVRVRYVPTERFRHGALQSIVDQLQNRMGAIQIEFEEVEQIPRTLSGKFRAVICDLSPDDRKKVNAASSPR